MDATLAFYSDDFEWKPKIYLIKGSDRYLWCAEWLWFVIEVVRYRKKGS